jgi:hypothetical protein
MQLLIAIAAAIGIGATLLVLFPPMTEQDRSIRDALLWDAKQAKLNRIITGGN